MWCLVVYKTMRNFEIYKINLDYIKYLMLFDSNVCFPKEEGYERPYVGIFIFETSNFYYFAPLSSQKYKSDQYCVKLKDPNGETIGNVRVNNMIPIPKSRKDLFHILKYQSYINSENSKDRNYGHILRYEMHYLQIKRVKKKIWSMANYFYKNYRLNVWIQTYCNNFPLLEQKAMEYKK